MGGPLRDFLRVERAALAGLAGCLAGFRARGGGVDLARRRGSGWRALGPRERLLGRSLGLTAAFFVSRPARIASRAERPP